MKITDKYLEVLEKCTFVTKKDMWFVHGSEAELDFLENDYVEGEKFKNGCAVFDGNTEELLRGYVGDLPREDI